MTASTTMVPGLVSHTLQWNHLHYNYIKDYSTYTTGHTQENKINRITRLSQTFKQYAQQSSPHAYVPVQDDPQHPHVPIPARSVPFQLCKWLEILECNACSPAMFIANAKEAMRCPSARSPSCYRDECPISTHAKGPGCRNHKPRAAYRPDAPAVLYKHYTTVAPT